MAEPTADDVVEYLSSVWRLFGQCEHGDEALTLDARELRDAIRVIAGDMKRQIGYDLSAVAGESKE